MSGEYSKCFMYVLKLEKKINKNKKNMQPDMIYGC